MGDFDRDAEDLGGTPERGRGGGRFGPRRAKFCNFCLDKVKEVPFKDGDLLRRYLTDRGKIRPRRQTGICAKHQRRLAVAVKRARHLAILPFTANFSGND